MRVFVVIAAFPAYYLFQFQNLDAFWQGSRKGVSTMRKIFKSAKYVLAAFWLSPAAYAQSAPPPIGTWSTNPASEQLVVNSDWTCAFFYMGKATVSGPCSWTASSAGGILDISYPMPLQPGHDYFNVIWLDQHSIQVSGDVFYRQ
jgi:hypothetical protein